MNCVKCGREIEEDQVFCQLCLEGMDAYPVKPGTVVHIPQRSEAIPEKKAPVRKKAARTPQEQIRRLKKRLMGLRILAAVLLLICGLLCFALVEFAEELDVYRFMGKNYSTEETVEDPRPATEVPTQPPTETRALPEITEP